MSTSACRVILWQTTNTSQFLPFLSFGEGDARSSPKLAANKASSGNIQSCHDENRLTAVACFLHVSAYVSFVHAGGDDCSDLDVKCRPTSSLVFLADLTSLHMEIYAGFFVLVRISSQGDCRHASVRGTRRVVVVWQTQKEGLKWELQCGRWRSFPSLGGGETDVTWSRIWWWRPCRGWVRSSARLWWFGCGWRGRRLIVFTVDGLEKLS